MKISNECRIWVRRLLTYLAIYLAVIIVSSLVFLNFDILHTDVDSARYMLSALIQSEAAIIAIVITLSLVAAQLAASSYSVRVIDIFRKTPDLWILQLVYGITIFWGLGVLKLIEKADSSCVSSSICQSNLENYIAFTYSLGIFAFVALAFYIWYTIGLLRPSTIIDILAKDITKENILESIEREKGDEDNPNDAILPIIDIVRSALMKYDYETARGGLWSIRVQIKDIFENDFKKEWELDTSNYLMRHLIRIGRLAIHEDDGYSTNEIIKTIQIIGVAAAENNLETIVYGTIINLKDIGIEAAKRDLEWPTEMALSAIEEIRTSYVKSYHLFNWDKNIENCNKKLIEYLTQSFGIDWAKTPNIEMNEGGEVITITDGDIFISLKLTDEITKIYLEIDNDKPIKLTAKKDHGELNIYKNGLDTRLSGSGWGEAFYLEKIGMIAIEHRLENAAQQVASSLELIGTAAAENNLTNTLSKSIKSLINMSECAKKERLCEVMKITSQCLLSMLKATSSELNEYKELKDAFIKVNANIKEICNKGDT